MRFYKDKIAPFIFDSSNPWKSLVLLVAVAHLVLLATPDLVLIFSMIVVFGYLIILTLSSFRAYTTQKKAERLSVYRTLGRDVLKKFAAVRAQLDKTSRLVLAVSPILTTWTTNSVLYRCMPVRKTRNALAPFVSGFLTSTYFKHVSASPRAPESSDDRRAYLLATVR